MGRTKTLQQSTLTNRGPYHPPGYGGYTPSQKFSYAKTFGSETAELVAKRKLGTASCIPQKYLDAQEEKDLIARRPNIGDTKLQRDMVPGYQGFIPQSQKFYGARYTVTTNHAIGNFAKDQEIRRSATGNLHTYTQGRVRLPAISPRATPYASKDTPPYNKSPFQLEDGDPKKYFVSGYGGHIPKVNQHYAVGFPLTSTIALSEFSAQNTMLRSTRGLPVNI